jgi:putative peptidoglycan lipid II flippase
MSIGTFTAAVTRRWQYLIAGSVNRQILGAILTIGITTFAVKLVAMLKDMIVAASFGTADTMDALLTAFLLPSFLINVIAGSFRSALIPVYVAVREKQGPEATGRLFAAVVMIGGGGLLALTVGLALAGPALLPAFATGFGPEKVALTRALFYLLLPTIFLNGLATIWGAVLNAGERFALASLAGMAVPLASAACLVLVGGEWGIFALAAGMVLGYGLQFALLLWGLAGQGLAVRLHWPRGNADARQVFTQYLPLLAGQAIMGSTTLVDQALTVSLGAGAVAALNYGNKLVAIPLGIGAAALSTAVLPYFSRMVARQDGAAIRHSLRTYSRWILVITIPFSLLFIAGSAELVRLLYQRGEFTAADTLLVSQIQAMYVLQLPFYTLGLLFARLIASLQANYILLYGTIINFALNAVLDYTLMQVFGVAGIALSNTLMYVVSCGFLGALLYRQLRRGG